MANGGTQWKKEGGGVERKCVPWGYKWGLLRSARVLMKFSLTAFEEGLDFLMKWFSVNTICQNVTNSEAIWETVWLSRLNYVNMFSWKRKLLFSYHIEKWQNLYYYFKRKHKLKYLMNWNNMVYLWFISEVLYVFLNVS